LQANKHYKSAQREPEHPGQHITAGRLAVKYCDGRLHRRLRAGIETCQCGKADGQHNAAGNQHADFQAFPSALQSFSGCGGAPVRLLRDFLIAPHHGSSFPP